MPAVAVVFVVLGSVLVALVALIGGNRLRLVLDRSSFPCRLARTRHHAPCGLAKRWSRFKTRARWRDDVLLVQTGPLWLHTLRVTAHVPLDARIVDEPCWVVRGLGGRPASLAIESPKGDVFLAVRERDRIRLAGPFLALACFPASRSDRKKRT
jgi:hypothetical protein